MKIPPYWAKDVRVIGWRKIHVYGTSAVSMAQARALMEERVRLWQEYLETDDPTAQDKERFQQALALQSASVSETGDDAKYSVSILEPIERKLNANNIVTRNRYGALVLNTTSLCFVDVDSFENRGFWSKLFSLKSPEQRLLHAVKQLTSKQKEVSARVYRTARGWRVVVQAPGLTINSPQMSDLFEYLQADALYTRLCLQQQCWRARISPKPFDENLPPFPTLSDSEHAREDMAEWVRVYEQRTAHYAVCRLVAAYGPPIYNPILEMHDQVTKALQPGLTLA